MATEPSLNSMYKQILEYENIAFKCVSTLKI